MNSKSIYKIMATIILTLLVYDGRATIIDDVNRIISGTTAIITDKKMRNQFASKVLEMVQKDAMKKLDKKLKDSKVTGLRADVAKILLKEGFGQLNTLVKTKPDHSLDQGKENAQHGSGSGKLEEVDDSMDYQDLNDSYLAQNQEDRNNYVGLEDEPNFFISLGNLELSKLGQSRFPEWFIVPSISLTDEEQKAVDYDYGELTGWQGETNSMYVPDNYDVQNDDRWVPVRMNDEDAHYDAST